MEPSAPAAAIFLPDTRRASHGQAAIRVRMSRNTKPPTMAMCTPEMDRMWVRPALRMAVTSSGSSHASWPVVMATATPPPLGPMSSIIREASDQRAALTCISRLSQGPGRGPSTIIGSDREKPTPPMRWK